MPSRWGHFTHLNSFYADPDFFSLSLSSTHLSRSLSLSLHLSARRREVEREKEMERGKEHEADVECYISSVRAGALFHTLEHLQCEDTTEGLQSHTQVNKTAQ